MNVSWRESWLISLAVSGGIMVLAVGYGLAQKGTGGWSIPAEVGQLMGAAIVTIIGNLLSIVVTVFTPYRKVSACMALLLVPTVILNAKLAISL